MRYSDFEYCFPDADNAAFDLSLRPLDPVLETVANHYRLKLFRHADRGWPGRMLRRRRGLRTYTLQVSLKQDYVRGETITWDITERWMYDYGEFFYKLAAFRLLGSGIDSTALANGWPSAVITEAIARNFC
jgi:hypothetical protein